MYRTFSVKLKHEFEGMFSRRRRYHCIDRYGLFYDVCLVMMRLVEFQEQYLSSSVNEEWTSIANHGERKNCAHARSRQHRRII